MTDHHFRSDDGGFKAFAVLFLMYIRGIEAHIHVFILEFVIGAFVSP